MARQIIPANPTLKRHFQKDGDNYLKVSEFFMDTIQGEGINLGVPAAFLRLQACTLNCTWCDTNEVWRYGNPWSFDELLNLMHVSGLIYKLKYGHHLIITGGSPLFQQERLANFLIKFIDIYGFKPYIEIENECVLSPTNEMISLVDCWNNSPKLTMSGNAFERRYKPEVINLMGQLRNSWFKFVVGSEEDWNEIDVAFLVPNFIRREQIILMPLGATRVELDLRKQIVVDLAIENGVRYATREHVVLWDKKTGV